MRGRVATSRLRQVILASTRGKVLDRLRRAPQTVEQLASSLGVTGNAVRSHLLALERDGLIRRGDLRTGARRPFHTYRLSPGAEAIFCQAYVPFLDQLLALLADRMSRGNFDELIRAVGRRLAPARLAEPLAARVFATAAFLEELGGIIEVKTRRSSGVVYVIHGLSCPLEALVRSHPGVCVAIQGLVAQMTRANTHEQCHRSADQPHCLIEVMARSPPRRDSPPGPAASR
jgi:predicted ArsR family transcriptional regulator